MSPPRKDVTVIDAGGHTIVLGRDALRGLGRWLDRDQRHGERFILGDADTLQLCLPELIAHVPTLADAPTIRVAPGEGSKDLDVCRDIWRHLAEREADRDAVLIALGGGVVTDIGGFVGGAYKRGIRTINLPTTLMGMVDAAIGGKTGVDLGGVKNIVGLYHDPLAVYVHLPFLRTLGKRELLNGLAEMMKHGLIADAAHWKAIGAARLHDLAALEPLILRSAAIKAGIVRDDPRESGRRKLLNFGHTIGHAVEALSWESPQRGLLHGEAIAIGMICEGWLSWRLGHLERGAFDAIEERLLGLFQPYLIEAGDHHRVISLMRNDKKSRHSTEAEGKMRFTLVKAIGEAVIDVPVTADQVKQALDHYRERVATLPSATGIGR